MADSPPAAAPPADLTSLSKSPASRPKSRSRLAPVLLLLLLGLVGYGAVERWRLAAEFEQEQNAMEAVRALKGAPIEGLTRDWRVVFAPDQPHLAQRVGGVYIPYEGQGPGYTQKVVDLLQSFTHCEEMILSAGPITGAISMGPAPKRVLAPGEIPPEPLDLDAIRAAFPRLKVSGDAFLQAPPEKPDPAEKPSDSGPETSTESGSEHQGRESP